MSVYDVTTSRGSHMQPIEDDEFEKECQEIFDQLYCKDHEKLQCKQCAHLYCKTHKVFQCKLCVDDKTIAKKN
jgi:hypothetical protein